MKIIVNRLIQSSGSTISTVEVNNRLKYYGIEPVNPIPAGTYALDKYFSPKHQRYVPVVKDVPGHSLIEIHVGNYPTDTRDCLCLGAGYIGEDFISASKIAIDEFYQNFFNALYNGEECVIIYKDLYKK